MKSLSEIKNKLPLSIRSLKLVQLIKQKWLMPLIDHDEIYNEQFYLTSVDPPARRSAPAIAKTIVSEFNPSTVIEVGCGTGALLMELQSMGVACFGLEYSSVALKICKSRSVNAEKFDLQRNHFPSDLKTYDVVVSMEVAEHLSEKFAESYVDLICSLGNKLVFTAAVPGQGGQNHVNEQPHEYWIEKIEKRGFSFLDTLSKDLRIQWEQGDVMSWYHNNLMIFEKV